MKHRTLTACISLLLTVAMLLVFIPAVSAANTGYYKVTATSLNVRSGPSTSYTSLGYVSYDDIVYASKFSGNWAYIKYGTLEGWSSMSYLSFIQSQIEEPTVPDGEYDHKAAGTGKIVAKGIDVSTWQGSINWTKVKASGIDFAIIRAGYSGTKDNYFETNYKNAKAAGVDIGVYIYSYADTIAEAKADANSCLTWLKGKTLEYPVYFDIEDENQVALSKDANTNIIRTFCDTMNLNGYLSGMYSGKYFTSTYINMSQILPYYEVWIAHYYDYTSNDLWGYSLQYGMWQYSSKGSVSGISGNVDMDVCYKDYPTIVKTYGFNGYKKPVAPTEPVTAEPTQIATQAPTQNVTQAPTEVVTQPQTQPVTQLPTQMPTIAPTQSPTVIGSEPTEGATQGQALLGDVNADGYVTITDATDIQRYLASMLTLSDNAKIYSDVDGDGYVTVMDATMIQKVLAQILSGFTNTAV